MTTSARRRTGRPVDHELAARRRADLIDAAIEVFAEIGYAKAGVVDITDRAGLGKGTFYQYFDSKRAVFDGAIDTVVERVTTLIMASAGSVKIATAEGLEDGIRAVAAGLFAMIDKTPGSVQVLMEGVQDEGIRQRLLSLSAVMESTVSGLLRHYADIGVVRSDLDCDFVAHVLMRVSLGAGIRMQRGDLATPAERQIYVDSAIAMARHLLVD